MCCAVTRLCWIGQIQPRLYLFRSDHRSLLSVLLTVPMWAVGAIVVLVLVLVACFVFCVFKKCFGKKKKPKKVRERKAGRRRKEKEGEGETGEKVGRDVVM